MSITIGTYVQIIPSKVGNTITREYWQGKTGKVTSLTAYGLIAVIDFSGDEGCFHVDKLQAMNYAPAARRRYTNLRIQDVHGRVHVLENLVDDEEFSDFYQNPTANKYKSTGSPVYFSQDYLNDKVASGEIKILGVGNAPVITKAANDDVYEDVVIAAKKYSQLEKLCVYKVNMNNLKEGYFTHVRKVDVGAWLCVAKGSEAFEDTQATSQRDEKTRWFLVREKDLTMGWLVGENYATFTPANEWPSMSDGLENAFTGRIEGNY